MVWRVVKLARKVTTITGMIVEMIVQTTAGMIAEMIVRMNAEMIAATVAGMIPERTVSQRKRKTSHASHLEPTVGARILLPQLMMS